ncbi:MAG: tetratricopeptide repeat protein, partial [Faecalibacterium prausnitzii]
EKNPDAYLPDLAISCNNLAYLLSDIGSFKEAEELYRESLKIRRNLAEENPKVYLPKLQLVCDNLTALLEKTGRREEADSLRREVAEFYQKQLAQQ